MSFFKSKRGGADVTKSSSKSSSNTTEPDSTKQKNASSAPSAKPGVGHSPSPASPVGGAAPSSKPNSQPRDQKANPDMQTLFETDCPLDDRIMEATIPNNNLSISRSGRFKDKRKMRARLFSEDADAGSNDGHPNQAARGSSSLATPEDRQTVLDAMARRTGATTAPSRSSTAALSSAAGNPNSKPESGASKKSSDRATSAKLSSTTHSVDL